MKKFLSMLLALCMIVTMLTGTIFVSADLIEEAEDATSAETMISLWDAEYMRTAKGVALTELVRGSASKYCYMNEASTELISVTNVYLPSAAKEGAAMYSEADTDDSSNQVLKVLSNKLQINYRANLTNADPDADIFTFSSKIKIPSEQDVADKTAYRRYWYIPFAIYSSPEIDTAWTSRVYEQGLETYVYFDYVDGDLVTSAKVGTENDSDITCAASAPMVIDEDEWYDVEIKWFIADGKTPYVNVYVGNKLIYSGTIGGSYVYNQKVTTSSTDETTGETTTTTEYKTVRVGDFTYTSSAITDATDSTKYVFCPIYMDEIKFSSEKAKTLPLFAAANISSASIATEGSTQLYGKIGYFQKPLSHSMNSTVDAVYTRDTESVPGETLINVSQNGKGLTSVLTTLRANISTDYIPIDATDPIYVEEGCDFILPVGTEDVERKFFVSTISNSDTFATTGVFTRALVSGNKLTVTSYAARSDHKMTKFSERAEDYTIEYGKLYNVKFVEEVTGTEETGYNVKVYGIINDEDLVYSAEWTYPAGEFGFNQFFVDITNPTDEARDTKLDNLNIAVHTDYTIPEKTSWNMGDDFTYPLYIEKSGDNANVEGLILNCTKTSADIVIAFYDADGKLIAPIVMKNVSNTAGADFEINESVVIPEGAAKAKAFLFDSLTSAKALTEHGETDLSE